MSGTSELRRESRGCSGHTPPPRCWAARAAAVTRTYIYFQDSIYFRTRYFYLSYSESLTTLWMMAVNLPLHSGHTALTLHAVNFLQIIFYATHGHRLNRLVYNRFYQLVTK